MHLYLLFVTIEDPIEEQNNNKIFEKKKERIIIVKSKHSTFSFFNILAKVIFLAFKCFIIIFSISIIKSKKVF